MSWAASGNTPHATENQICQELRVYFLISANLFMVENMKSVTKLNMI